MFNFFKKSFIKENIIVFLITIFIFGLIGYVRYNENRYKNVQIESKEKDIKISQMDEKFRANISEIQGLLLSTATNLTSVLEREQQRNDSLKKDVKKMTNTVDMLKKLSRTDPELLKKYSKAYFLNEHYIPISLSSIPTEYRTVKSTNFEIHSDVLSYLIDLIDAANEAELSLRVLSGYRSFGTQSSLKANYTLIYGAGTANRFSADQGYSEHQLGTTVDFTTEKTAPTLEGFDKTAEYSWLLENAYKYGFILSYPAGNDFYKFEPWHWRFVGTDLAERLSKDQIYFYEMDQRVIDSYLGTIFD